MLFAKPLSPHSVCREYFFSDGLAIKRLPQVDWTRAAAKGYLSAHEFEEFKNVEFWLCGDWNIPQASGYQEMHKAVLAVQVLCPTGDTGVCLAFDNLRGGPLENIGIKHTTGVASAFEGRLRELENSQPELLGTVFLRIQDVFNRRIMRLVNPIELFFEGLRVSNDYISPLLWTAGLDMLLMAGGKDKFAERVGILLGPNSYVFPSDHAGRQLKYTVEELAGEVYQMRNLTAHGQDIPKEYRNYEELQYLGTGKVVSHLSPLYRYELLGGASAALLCSTLRKLLFENLADDVADIKTWRKRLEGRI